jgi:hypothetical protein
VPCPAQRRQASTFPKIGFVFSALS